jgi:outer membrane protein
VEYAAKNNISVKQADVQARLAALEVERTKLSQYPTANANTNLGTQFGRSIDPTTNQFTTTQLLFQGINVNLNVPVFNWGALKADRQIAGFNAQAALADIERISNDVSLSIATFFLQVVAAKQQIAIAEVQIGQTESQLGFTRKRVEAGALPELSTAEIEAQLARDSTTLVSAKATFQQAVIQLKAAINLDMSVSFDVEIPAVDKIPLQPLGELDPAILYQLALNNQPAQKVSDLRIKSAEVSIKRARSEFYPTISAFGGLGTNFANSANTITGANIIGVRPTTNFVTVNNQNYQVFQPDIQLTSSKRNFFQMWNGWGGQLEQNFRQNFGINIQVPIFNAGSAKLGYERSKLNLRSAQITRQQADLTLQQNIYQAHTNAIAAIQRFHASDKSVEASQKAYDYARKRFEAGLSNTLDLITNQNNLLRAKLDRLNNQFDYIFRIKLLEFYKGQGIKL